jgi:YD repeat-containing protein
MKRYTLLGLIVSLGLGISLLLFYRLGISQSELSAPLLPGQTATVLPDGRWLLLGGENSRNGVPVATATIYDTRSSSREYKIEIGNLNHARAWHTATMLPDGSVFILGGFGVDSKIVSEAEIFDVERETFHLISSQNLTARAEHTATLLTDGRLLIAGGLGANGRPRDDAELWNFEGDTVESLSSRLSDSRYNHSATLLSDGRVLLSDGLDRNGNGLANGELFDPSSGLFTTVSASQIETLKAQGQSLEMAASLPSDGSVDVPLESLIAVRFTRPMRVETINHDTVILSGPSGIETIKVVPAEAGMLAFITPQASLLPGSTYAVTLNGPVAKDGFFLPFSSFSFSTESDDSPPPPSPPPPDGDTNPGYDYLGDDGWVWKGELRDGKPHSPWQDLPPLQAQAGVTALSGQVLDLKGEPLTNVTLQMGYGSKNIKVKTNDTGRFLIEYAEPGWSELMIDGRQGHNPKSQLDDPKWGYGIFEYGLDITEGRTTVLPFTIWLPKIDVTSTATIPSPTTSEIVVTTPKISGLEVHIPADTVIYDYEWKVTNQLNITRIPQDRTPFPLPKGVVTPALFTIQPGGGYVRGSKGVSLVYPNYTNIPLLPGTRLEFWHYDPGYQGWYVYGLGTVTEEGRQVVPDPGISIREFTGAMIGSNPEGPPEGPRPGNDTSDGDPVDLGTGLFVLNKTDLFLPDVTPLSLTRTYRQNDTVSRSFGIGATHQYDMYLYSTNDYVELDLILPDGGRVHYVRISPCNGSCTTDFTGAVYEHTETPSKFYKSTIRWGGTAWVLTLKDQSVYVFPESCPFCPAGGLIAVRDRFGNQVTIDRSGGSPNPLLGKITKITSPNGRWIQFTYDTANRITQATDNIGRAVNYTYDGTGRLTRVTDLNGGVTEYTYDGFQRMVTLKDARQIIFLTNEYDSTGKVIKQTLADGSIYNFAYTLDANNKIIRTDVTDPRGNVRRVTFNSAGYTLTDTHALGKSEEQTITFERQGGTNQRLSTIDALNRKTAFSHDSIGNVVAVTRLADTPDAVTTTYTYEPKYNNVTTITDPLNHTMTFGFDLLGPIPDTVMNPLGERTEIRFNNQGQITSIIDPLNNTTQHVYDAFGDFVSLIDPLGNTTNRFIDPVGRLGGITNPLGNVTEYDYDSLNRLTKVTDPLDGLTQFGYDPNGNLLTVTDAKNQNTSYVYNNMDRLETRTDPLLHAESYVYDNNGNLSQFTDRKSQVTNYTYDALNRRTGVTYADGSTTTYTYDKGNRLVEINDSISAIITRTYDGLDRLTSETTPQGSISYTYDNAGRRITMTVSGQQTVNYTYDDANRLTQITQGSSVVTLGYDAAGRRISLTLPNGILVQYVYDAASRVIAIWYSRGTTVLGDIIYEYDRAGNRTRVGGSWGRTGIPEAVSSTNYNVANQQVAFGDKTLAYDNNGNLESILDANGTTLYNWNARNQLTGIGGPGDTPAFSMMVWVEERRRL